MLVILAIFKVLGVTAQGSEETIDEIIVRTSNEASVQGSKIETKRISSKLPSDVGQLMTLFPGVQLRSYGGVGGMKTANFRSLGAGHTTVVSDYMIFSTTQSGMNDLGQIPADFLQKLEIINMAATSVDYPVSAKLSGCLVSMVTKHAWKDRDSNQLGIGLQGGSFQSYSGNVMALFQKNKWKASISGKYRQFEGNYPFEYWNANTRVKTSRKNGDLQDLFGTLSLIYNLNKQHTFSLQINGSKYDKGLPGAVVFYNETADQRLSGNGFTTAIQHQFTKNSWQTRTSFDYQQGFLNYLDSSYLNAQGYLSSDFWNQQYTAQTQVSKAFKPWFKALYGASLKNEQLHSNQLSIDPARTTLDQILGFHLSRKGKLQQQQSVSAQLGLNGIDEQRPLSNQQKWNFLPSVEIAHSFNLDRQFAIGYKRVVRQPSFSELYYQQIGNTSLKAEVGDLAYFRFSNWQFTKKVNFQTVLQPFFTYTSNKILAIPTKNLFIWSIINVGKSQAFGTEVTQNVFYSMKKASLALRLNYTFMYANDISDRNSETYGDLLSYSPLHTGSAELSLNQRKWSAFLLMTYQGERYALNQNIPSNLLEDFVLIDCGASYDFQFKQQHLLVRATLNNLTNNYYSYMRYFVMPGINFNIHLTYAL